MTPFGLPGITFESFPLAFMQAMGAPRSGEIGVAPAPHQRAGLSSASRGAIEPMIAVTIHAPGSPLETRKHVSGAGEDKKAFFEAFARYELERREARLLGAALDVDRKADGAQMKLEHAQREVDTFSRALTRVRTSWGTQLSLGESETDIEALLVEHRELVFYVDREGDVPLRVGSGLFQQELTPPGAVPAGSSGVSRATARPRRRRPFRAARREPRAGYDSKKMLREYEVLSGPGRFHLERRLAAAQRQQAATGRQAAADLQSKLERLDHERDCVRIGEGWFLVPGGWVRAKVVDLAFHPCDETSDAELSIQVGNGAPIRWQNGECQVEQPPSCCSIL